MPDKELIYREDLIAEYDRVHKGHPGGARELMRLAPAVDAVVLPEGGIGNLSDGYHTFNELYHHRAILFSVICNTYSGVAWKSKKHHDGSMFDGMFIVGIETPQGQATYHYDIDTCWDMFKVKELEHAPKWDGHISEQAIERIKSLNIVRCRYCVHYCDDEEDERYSFCANPKALIYGFMPRNGYCSYGERRSFNDSEESN